MRRGGPAGVALALATLRHSAYTRRRATSETLAGSDVRPEE